MWWLISTVPSSVAAHPSSVFEFAHFRQKYHRFNSFVTQKYTFIKIDSFEYALLPCTHSQTQYPVSESIIQFVEQMAQFIRFNWFWDGNREAEEKNLCHRKCYEFGVNGFWARATYQFVYTSECCWSENRFVINFVSTQWCTLQWIILLSISGLGELNLFVRYARSCVCAYQRKVRAAIHIFIAAIALCSTECRVCSNRIFKWWCQGSLSSIGFPNSIDEIQWISKIWSILFSAPLSSLLFHFHSFFLFLRMNSFELLANWDEIKPNFTVNQMEK